MLMPNPTKPATVTAQTIAHAAETHAKNREASSGLDVQRTSFGMGESPTCDFGFISVPSVDVGFGSEYFEPDDI